MKVSFVYTPEKKRSKFKDSIYVQGFCLININECHVGGLELRLIKFEIINR